MSEEPKRIRSRATRLTPQQRMDLLLSKKPTSELINRRGVPAESLKKQSIEPKKSESKVKQKNVRNGSSKRFKRSLEIVPAALRTMPIAREIELPDWMKGELESVDVSIIIPMYRSHAVIGEQIRSWVAENSLKIEIIYVDDACPQKSHQQIVATWVERKEVAKNHAFRLLLHSRNGGFAAACNAGAEIARGKRLVFLNADTIVTENWLRPMWDCLDDETIGLVGNLHIKKGSTKVDSLGSKWHQKSGAFLHIGRHIDDAGALLEKPFREYEIPSEYQKIRDVEMVTGACFMISNSVFKKIGGFDTNYHVGYWEDSDLNMKVHAHGLRIVCQPASKIYHEVSHSRAGGHPFMNENRNYFYKKWVDSGLMSGYIDSLHGKRKKFKASSDSIVVYTAISNGYDSLKDQPKSGNEQFVAFLDEQVKSKTWKTEPIWKEFSDPNRNAKIHKILPHRFFPDKEYSLWIDGSVRMKFPFDITRLVEVYLSDHDLAIFKHPDRNCIFQEANVCLLRRLDNPDVIRRQVERYTSEGYPSNFGLVEATIILRRHTPKTIEFCEAWWEEIVNGSRRDQISFNYVARKLNFKYRYFPGTLRKENYLFEVGRHARTK